MKQEMRVCVTCARNRALRFFPADARRSDGLSTRCVTCKKRKSGLGSRNQRLVETYGITQLDYDRMLEHQNGVCAICGGTRPGNLDVDHDHKLTGRDAVRGLLCKRCNRRLLPAAQDNPARLKRAIAYLNHPPAREVLAA